MSAYIVIGVIVLMVIAFVMNKWPFGLVTLSCCAILGIAGVLGPAEVFSGFANPFVVMLAGCLVVTGALGKTSFIHNLQNRIVKMQEGKSGALLMAIFVIAIIILATFMPGPSLLAIVIVMAGNLDDSGEVNAPRVILPAAALTTLWNARIPFGLGAGAFAILNGFLEPYGSEYTVGMFDPFKAAIFPGVALALLAIFGYKLLPHKGLAQANNGKAEKKEEKEWEPPMSKKDEIFTYVVFIVMLLVMIFNNITGNLMYIGPAVCALVLIFAKVVTVDDAKKAITADLIFMLAGIFTLTSAMSSTGAGDLIGHTIISLMGGASSELGLIALFGGITVILTNFMSNNATMYSMIPVAITTAIAAGVNPVPLVLTIDVASKASCLLPCSSGEAAMCYGGSGYTPKETIKYTVVSLVVYYVALIAGMMILF